MSISTPSDLDRYQWRAIKFALRLQCAALFLDIGLGKTIIILSLVVALLRQVALHKPALIIAPARVLKFNVWQNEAKKWTHTRHLRIVAITGSARQRQRLLEDSTADIFLISAENTRWLCKLLKRRTRWPFGLLAIDESTKFKSHAVKRFRALASVVERFDMRYILTGAPTPDTMLNLWSQIFLVDLGERLGTVFTRYRERFFKQMDYRGYTYALRPGAQARINRQIRDVSLYMEAKDWLTMPPLIENPVRVALPPHAMALYRELEKEMFIEMELIYVEAISAAALSQKCHQFANGAVYAKGSAGERIVQHVHDAKLEALQEIIDGTGSPVLVTYQYKHDLARLQKTFPKAPVLDDVTQHSWNKRKHRVAFLYPGHGLNLWEGGHTLAFFSLTWSGEQRIQTIGRIGPARQARSKEHVERVMVHYLIATDTVDEAIMIAQERKAKGQRALLQALKGYQQGERYV